MHALPATPEQQKEITRLLAASSFSVSHHHIYAHLLPSLSWVAATQLINKLSSPAPRPNVLEYASQGTCSEGLQSRHEYAAVVQLTRTAPGDSGGRFCRAQPGQPIYLSYYTN
jgi:hypothetical protein